MRYSGLIKRILPFVLTFAASLFIASFFLPVGISRPFSDRDRSRKNECRKMMIKIQDSEAENLRLRMKISRYESESQILDQEFVTDGELPLVPAPPIAPVAQHRHR